MSEGYVTEMLYRPVRTCALLQVRRESCSSLLLGSTYSSVTLQNRNFIAFGT